MTDITRILSTIEQGDPHAAEQLLPVVYDEPRRLAAQEIVRQKPGQNTAADSPGPRSVPPARGVGASPALGQPSPLRRCCRRGHPAHLRHWDSRRPFVAAAVEAIRRIFVENARRKHACKHGGDLVRHDLDDFEPPHPKPAPSCSRSTRRWIGWRLRTR
jgi:hypothetical protein